MSDDKNFLEKINEEKKLNTGSIESFKVESFESVKQKPKILPYVTLIIVIVMAIAAYYYFTLDEVIIVDFSGMELEQVEEWSQLNGVMVLSQPTNNSLVDEGLIIEQNLEVGYSMKQQDTLVVKVSNGPNPYETLELPRFDKNWSKSSVQAWLESNKVSNFAFKYIEDEVVEGDYLINYILTGAKEDNYSRSASIEFVFSQPEEGATEVMPNFLGRTLADFDTWAIGQGFTYTYTESYSKIYNEGIIMEQNFTPNMERLLTEPLEVIVSKGESTETVIMENLVNMTISEARSWLANNDLTITTSKRYNEDFAEDRVIEQSIKVGNEIVKETEVKLVISVGEAVIVPDFTQYTYSNHSLATQIYGGNVLVNQRFDEVTPVNQLISQSILRGTANDGNEPIEVIYSLGNSILIPDFRDGTITDIDAWVRQQNYSGASLKLVITEDSSLNEDYGVIFQQNHYNKSINMDEIIEIVVATQKVVPNFATMTLLEAETFATTCGYPVIIEHKYQLYTSVNEFIWQSVSKGELVDSNTLVLVNYSLGMKVIIDDYRGQPLSALESVVMDYKVQGMDIRINIVEQYNDEVPYGMIISQNIISSSITTGDTIDVIISLGESYFVQRFYGYSRLSVEKLAEIYSLNIVFLEEESSKTSGTVIKQSIEAGTTISRNEFIYITIAK